MLRLAYGISIVLLATLIPPATSADDGAAGTDRVCQPQIHLLSPLEGDTDSRLTAMNIRGWAVGKSWHHDPTTGESSRSSIVLWRDGRALDLQAGGAHDLDTEPMDINRRGVVAIQRWGSRRAGRSIPATSWLWSDGSMVRLRGGQSRQHVFVEALNDRGVAVGSARGDSGTPLVPLLWTQGEREILPVPSGASGGAVDVNNHGLVVGNVHLRGSGTYEYTPWYWRPSGENGPLRIPAGEDLNVRDVDNRGRILGSNGYEMGPRAFLWSSSAAWPRYLGRGRATAVAMSDHGDLTGSAGGFRGLSARAWTGHVADTRSKPLPRPGTGGWQNTFGVAVIRAATFLAPQGGVSVGGTSDASPETGFDRATVWTCTQTY